MYFQERRTRECRTLIHKLIIANVCSKSFPIIESCFDCCSTSVFTVAFSQLYGGVVTVVWRCCHSCMEMFSQLYGDVFTVVWRCCHSCMEVYEGIFTVVVCFPGLPQHFEHLARETGREMESTDLEFSAGIFLEQCVWLLHNFEQRKQFLEPQHKCFCG